MNFKKLLIASVIMTATTSIAFGAPYKERGYKDRVFKDQPAPCPTVHVLNDGFYIGATGAYDSARDHESASLVNNITGRSTALYNSDLSANGWLGGLYLGDGRYFHDVMYLGGEIFGNLSTNFKTHNISLPSNSDTLGSVNSALTMGNNYGLSFIPGIKVNDGSLVYARLGYKWTNFKYQATATTTNGEATTGSSSVNKSKIEGGFNAGVGIETLLYGNWSLRGEYTYTRYDSYNTSVADPGDPTAISSSLSISPTDNQFSLGLTYHIA